MRKFRITVSPGFFHTKETIIEVGLEPQRKWTYRKTRQAAKVAIEVEDKTGITIVLC
jgi:hypothetical protein